MKYLHINNNMEALINYKTLNTYTLQKAVESAPKTALPILVMITSYPPRECGIATYANDLFNSLNKKFDQSFTIQICAIEQKNTHYSYAKEVKYKLNTSNQENYIELANQLNSNEHIQLILVQQEFGFYHGNDQAFQSFLSSVKKPIIIALHTVLGKPNETQKVYMQLMLAKAIKTIVMTKHAATILIEEYNIESAKINIISHGTHLVKYTDKIVLKRKYGFLGRKILSTFGLLNSGKSIETTLDALVQIIKKEPTVLFLIIGITHPEVVKNEGEIYRESLKEKIKLLHLEDHVLFINRFLELPELLDHLQLTEIYLFTSNNSNQAVSGTFSYAISSGCPIIATSIPHALEVLANNTGIIVEFNNSQQLSSAILTLLENHQKREEFSLNGIHKLASTAWENSALKHAAILNKSISHLYSIHSTRAMAFIIKGLSYSIKNDFDKQAYDTINILANRVYQMYLHESKPKWEWYESYLTYANSLLPEAMLYAWEATGNELYKKTAKDSFHFLISQTFDPTGIHVVSNKNWHNNTTSNVSNLVGGEQPIDVAYTILSLISFYKAFKSPFYKQKIKIAFDWFQGRNHLNEIVYNPCTGGCYDGLEDSYVNLNQGAESTVSYLMARLAIEKYDFPNF